MAMNDARPRLADMVAPVFHNVLRDLKAERHSEYWLMGGRGSGKSSFISVAIIRGMLLNPQANAIIYRRVAATLRESVYEQMVWAIDRMGLRAWFSFRVSPMEIRFKPTGQRILFRGADDPGKSKSIKLSDGYFAYLWFEEAAEFRGMSDIRTIQASILRGSDRHTVTFYSYNPPISARNWVNKEAMNAPAGRLKHSSNYLDLPRSWLGEDFIARAAEMKKTNEREYRHMYLGEVTGTGGNVFENLKIRPITDQEIESMGAFYQGIDWGYFPDPFHWARMAYDPARRALFLIDEFRTVRTGNAEAFERIREKLREDESLIADSAEKKSVADFKEYGAWWIRGAVKGPGSVDYSMKWLSTLSEIVIDPARCPAAAKEFREYEFEQNGDGDFVPGYPDRDNHAIDAVRYALSPIWRRKGE